MPGWLAVYLDEKENAMKRVIEIRAAEGGEDSKLFVSDLATAYSKLGSKLG
jgi:protein subunit release factor A